MDSAEKITIAQVAAQDTERKGRNRKLNPPLNIGSSVQAVDGNRHAEFTPPAAKRAEFTAPQAFVRLASHADRADEALENCRLSTNHKPPE